MKVMELKKCLVELDEVLKQLPKEYIEKIPEDILKGIEEKKDKEYVWKYDKNKELKKQNLDRDTIILLSYLNMEYLLNSKQRDFMQNIHMQNEQKLEFKKKEKYNSDNLFKNNKPETIIQAQSNTNEVAIIQYKESFLKKIINKIKIIFRLHK